MKKLVPIMVFVLTIALGTSALASNVEDKMVVTLEILPYIQVDLADTLDFGQIDFGDGIGFGRRTKTANMRITSNVDIGVLFESRGFVDSEGNKISLLNEWVQYEINTGSTSSLSDIFNAGGKMNKDLTWNGDTHVFTIDVHFLRTDNQQKDAKDKWHTIRANEFNDVLTVTVFAQ